jgi:hypothetical protein
VAGAGQPSGFVSPERIHGRVLQPNFDLAGPELCSILGECVEVSLGHFELGVVPGKPAILFRTPSGKTREYPNPLTGGKIVVELRDHKKLESLGQFENAVADLRDYDIDVSGFGTPKLAPLPIDVISEYHVGVTCFVSSALRSTSDYHDESGPRENVVRYRKLCPETATVGVFSNPHNLEIIDVPHAGSARFWIQFELGKFLFPNIKGGNLELLNPAIVDVATQVFGIPFVQGCYWG